MEFKNHKCGGLFNSKFVKNKLDIISKRGKRYYDAISVEYNFGYWGHSSVCNYSCKFCGSKREKTIHQLFIKDFLSKTEILHFIHYVSSQGAMCNMFNNICHPGEPFMYPDNEFLLNLYHKFALGKFLIYTNGHFLNDKFLRIIKENNFSLNMFVHTLNSDLRKEIMGYDFDLDAPEFYDWIIKSGVDFVANVVALKSSFSNGDLLKTLEFFDSRKIVIFLIKGVYYSDTYDANTISEFDYSDEFIHKFLEELGFSKTVLYLSNQVPRILNNFMDDFKIFLKQFDGKKVLSLSPSCSFDFVNRELSSKSNVSVRKILTSSTFSVPISWSITVADLLRTLESITEDYDVLIVPKASFDFRLRDNSNVSISKLVSKIDKEIYLF